MIYVSGKSNSKLLFIPCAESFDFLERCHKYHRQLYVCQVSDFALAKSPIPLLYLTRSC